MSARLTHFQAELMDKIETCVDQHKWIDYVMQIPEVATPETPEYETLGQAAEAKLRQLNTRHERA